MTNQRKFFRLDYPPIDRPRLEVKPYKKHFLVLDLSEEGMRFQYQGDFDMEEGELIKGRVHFSSGKNCEIEGKILRLYPDKKWCALILTKGIPLSLMMEENRLLIARYKQ